MRIRLRRLRVRRGGGASKVADLDAGAYAVVHIATILALYPSQARPVMAFVDDKLVEALGRIKRKARDGG